MKCDRCNFENPENESYCINCGQKLPEKPMVTHIIVKFSNKIPLKTMKTITIILLHIEVLIILN